jgi:sec-independent protein translocase protein TatC
MSKEQEADREKLEDETLAASEEASAEISADARESAPADQPESDGAADAAPGDDSVSGSAGQDDSSSSGVVADDGVDADDPALTGNSAREESAPGEAGAPEESSVPAAQDEAGGVQVRGESGTEEAKGPAKEEAAEEEPPREMTFTEHLNELRVRLVRCLIAIFIGFLACYGFAEQLFMLLMEPLITLLEPSGGSLIYTGLPEAFFTHLKVAALAGLFLASPYVFYQIWMFIAPGLYEGERKYMIPIALCSALCFITGALFGYFVVFPFGFQFFLGYASEAIQPMPSVKEYFSFSTSMLFAFGLIFELPLFMLFLSVLGVVNYKTLRRYRKFAILGNFVVAAVLTPPDVVSQTLMAGPMCLLYEVGIWVSYMFGKKPKEEPPEEEAEASQAKA